MRGMLKKACEHGYVWGCHANGGAYLMTVEANRRFGDLSAVNDPRCTFTNWVTEDVFYAIAIHAVALQLVPQQSPGDIFASCWQGLAAHSLEEAWDRNNCIVHSLKDFGPFRETESRQFFRKQRLNANEHQEDPRHPC